MAIKRFSDESNISLENRALQIYQILIGCAYNQQVYTYGDIASILGYKGSGTLDCQLGHIMFWCDENNLPPLTVLVVNQKTGLPGVGLQNSEQIEEFRVTGRFYLTEQNWPERQRNVFEADWYDITPPTVDELKQAYLRGMGRAE